MFRHILVPLDGSHMAEAALPAAARLAATVGARVTLVHVIERGAPQEIHGEPHLTDAAEALRYLDAVAARAFPAGAAVDRHVHESEVADVARGIAEHAAELSCDLVAMCTHGSGGLRGLVFGRIAQQVSGLGATPVLLVPPEGAEAGTRFACKKLLVTLDGNPEHEEGVEVAAGLARACGAGLHLVMAVPTSGTLSGEEAATAKILPAATREILDLAAQDARGYLGRHVDALRARGLEVTAEVRRGEPAGAIVDTALRAGADLIVLATHGKTGLDAFWSGSATPSVASRTAVPLLLVPVRGGQAGAPAPPKPE